MPSPVDLGDFLTGPAPEIAPRLLGAMVTHASVTVRLTEVEAYSGPDDPGSHAYRGPTPRNEVMFGAPGHLYCYLSYGLHVCANVTLGPEGEAGAVLLRAGEVIEGIDHARRRAPHRTDRDLARGPGRLGQSLGLTIDSNGVDLRGPQASLHLRPAPAGVRIDRGPRVGLSAAADRPWRFWIPGDRTVSAYRRSPRAAPVEPAPPSRSPQEEGC